MLDAGIFLALQEAHAAEGQCLHFVLAGHDADRRDEFDVVLHTLRQHFGVGHAARQDDGVAVALEHDGQQANGLGDLIGLRLEDQVGMAVAVAVLLLDVAAVARAEVGIHAAAAADLFPLFLIGIFAVIAELFLGLAVLVVLALTVILACLKTSIGLVTSCAETFTAMFPNGPKYGFWATCFSIFSLLVTNIGLNAIIAISLPVLMFLFPLAITLILLALLGNLYGHDTVVYRWVTGFTLAAALIEFVKALPKAITETPVVSAVIGFADSYLPFFELGLGWICPAAVGLFVGLIFHRTRRNRPAA